MIVRCKRIFKFGMDKLSDKESDAFQTVGKCYQVLELKFDDKARIYYRIIPNDEGTSILVRAQDYEIVSNKLPKNWVITFVNGYSYNLAPERWWNFDIWNESFWQDYYESTPEALQCYEEELAIILATENLDDFQDPQYIPRYIDPY